MKMFLAFVKKEFLHIFRDKRTMLILLLMPLVQLLLFGFAITTEVRNVNIAVLDLSKDISTQRIVNQISSSEYFNIATTANSIVDVDNAFKSGEVTLAIIFSQNFQQSLYQTGNAQIQLIADGTDPNQARMQVEYASSIIKQYQQELMGEYNVPIQIVPQIRMLYNPQIKSSYNFVPGVMGLILMLICAMMTSISIVREKETGTMEVLLTSPIKPIFIIIAKAIPYIVVFATNLTTILLLSVYVLDVPVAGSLISLLFVSFIYIFVNLSLGLMISSVVSTQVGAMLISSMGLMMPVMLLSGMIFPVESMPIVLQWISKVIPASWYILSVKKLMISGLNINSVYQELTILLGMCFVLVAVSLKSFKKRLS